MQQPNQQQGQDERADEAEGDHVPAAPPPHADWEGVVEPKRMPRVLPVSAFFARMNAEDSGTRPRSRPRRWRRGLLNLTPAPVKDLDSDE